MKASLVVITRDEADRLKLALASLEMQDRAGFEVIVVDDGSNDDTPKVLADAAMDLRVIRHEAPRGRSAARNAGARIARGQFLIFSDGDTLLGPGFFAAYAPTLGTATMTRGETHHLRCTRFFRDPETLAPMPESREHVARMTESELARSRVTLEQVRHDFAAIDSRAEPGIYAGLGPRRLFEVEMSAIRENPGLSCIWMVATGQNFGVERAPFEQEGGYDEGLALNEHRELALRLQRRGGTIALAEGARSYHLTHRTGFRDPLAGDTSWERFFYAKHPTLATKLMVVFWQSVVGDKHIPLNARIPTLVAFEQALLGDPALDWDEVRRAHPVMQPLG